MNRWVNNTKSGLIITDSVITYLNQSPKCLIVLIKIHELFSVESVKMENFISNVKDSEKKLWIDNYCWFLKV